MYVRVVLNRKKAEIRLNIEILPHELKKWDEKMMRFSDREMHANVLLNKIEQKFQDFRYRNATSLNNYNVKAIRDLIMGLELKRSLSIIAYIDKYYNSAIAPNAQMAEGTKRNYRKVLKHLKDFLAFRKSKGAELRDMNVAFA